MLQPSGYMKVCSHDNLKPSKKGATAIKRWGGGGGEGEGGGGGGGSGEGGGGGGVVGREGGGGKGLYVHNKIYT